MLKYCTIALISHASKVMLKILQARLQLYVNRELPDVLAGFTSLMAQTVKRLSTVQETWVQSLGQEDLLEKEMATHSSILAWKIPSLATKNKINLMLVLTI